MTLKPESAEFLDWCRSWLRGRGYKLQNGLPWKSLRYSIPTLIYCLDDCGLPAFGLGCHYVNLGDLVKRLGHLMTVDPRPIAVYIFVPRNSPFHVEVELEGAYSFQIEIIEGPDYSYDLKHYEGHPWKSGFLVRLSKRDPEPRE